MDDEENIKLIFLGDISLNGRYIKMYQENQNPFTKLNKNLGEADYVIGNLESFVRGDKGENHLKKPRLTTTIEALNYLKHINLDVACLANNHVYDHLESGFHKTVEFLQQNDIQYLGAADSKEEASIPVIIEKGNIKIGILNYVTHDTNPKIPDEAGITPNFFLIKKVIKDIETLKEEVDHVVLSLHWGGKVEGGLFPDYKQPLIARKLIDKGADLIVGHHSHTVQPYEKYKGKYIFYSLGNFCFSDYWFNKKYYPLPNRRKLAAILDMKFDKNQYSTNLSFYINNIDHFERLENYSLFVQNWLFLNLLKLKPLWFLYFAYLKIIVPFYLFIVRDDLSFRQKIVRLFVALNKRIKRTYL